MSNFKNSNLVRWVDDFLDKDSLESLQKLMLNISYSPATNPTKAHYGHEHQFSLDHFKNDPLLKKIKEEFLPYENLKPVEIRAHMRHNTEKLMPHRDAIGDKECFSFLLYVKGNSLLYNGTGLYGHNNQLNTYIGFVENRAIFFNAGKIFHTDLQSLGESSPRYSLNVFYE